MQAGVKERAESELAGVMKRLRGDGWPMRLAEYYLGRMDIDRLLKEANEEKLLARQRQCDVFFHVGELFAARADAAAAAEWKGRRDAECKGSLAGAP